MKTGHAAAFIFASCVAGSAFYVQSAAATPPARPDRVEIVPDQAHGTVTIRIDGKPIMFLTSTTLHVAGDLRYSGSLQDYGPDGFRTAIGQPDAR